jgi:hypothetical protein
MAAVNEAVENAESETEHPILDELLLSPQDAASHLKNCIITDDSYLLYEQAEDETLARPPLLPTEMLVKIMALLDPPDLIRSTMLVCKRWNLVSKQVILNQVDEMDSRCRFSWNKKDLRSHVPKDPPQAVSKQLAHLQDEHGITVQFLRQIQNVKLLSFFHFTHFEIHHEIGLHCESARDLIEGEDGPE